MAIQPVNRQVIGYQGPTKLILVADDQQENRQLLQHLLEPLGFEVLPAEGGQAAVSSAQRRRPDLIVMDLRMPEMSGFAAAHAIHQSRDLAMVPIVAASASTADLERAQADQQTFAACLRKPFEGVELFGIIGSLLNLTWRYDGAVGTDSAPISEPMETRLVAPPGAILAELLELARLGKLVRIEQIALRMERGDARYRPFARRLYALARDLDEERLIALLQEGAEEHRDVATH